MSFANILYSFGLTWMHVIYASFALVFFLFWLFMRFLKRSARPYNSVHALWRASREVGHTQEDPFLRRLPHLLLFLPVTYYLAITIMNAFNVQLVKAWLVMSQPVFETAIYLNPGYFERLEAARMENLELGMANHVSLMAHGYGLSIVTAIIASIAYVYLNRGGVIPRFHLFRRFPIPFIFAVTFMTIIVIVIPQHLDANHGIARFVRRYDNYAAIFMQQSLMTVMQMVWLNHVIFGVLFLIALIKGEATFPFKKCVPDCSICPRSKG